MRLCLGICVCFCVCHVCFNVCVCVCVCLSVAVCFVVVGVLSNNFLSACKNDLILKVSDKHITLKTAGGCP